ncbi:hypothetical protein [Bradyrhizobium sp. NC92]|uniref:hypothetical protein n=1 Tax=Bradyrhizobium sp. (strain NC92) TaxID=55395 RepID=UPI0021AAFF0D|nr:hypothetical protein [Bradyrhizobium sp. NC92]UWU71972.1 hypothetical protein N2602_15990 [Bradyrhizobium sp. NC92]
MGWKAACARHVHREIKKNLFTANVIRRSVVDGAALVRRLLVRLYYSKILVEARRRGYAVRRFAGAERGSRAERSASCIERQSTELRVAIRNRYGGRPQSVLPLSSNVNHFFTVGRSKKFQGQDHGSGEVRGRIIL